MTVIEMASEWKSIEFVDGTLPGRDHSRPDSRHAVHCRRVNAMKVDGVWMTAAVDEINPNTISFDAADTWTWNAIVICPRREENAWSDLNLLIGGYDRVFT